MDEEVRCKIEIEDLHLDEIESPAIDENTEEENANKKEEEKIVDIKQEPDKAEYVEIKQEQIFSDEEDCQTNIESVPCPISIRTLNTTIEIDEMQKIENIELDEIGEQTHVQKDKSKRHKKNSWENSYWRETLRLSILWKKKPVFD